MSILISSDLHLTDKDRDEYRWGLFPWLKEQAKKHHADTIMFLGDTTDAKDKHSSKLTNRIVDIFTDLSTSVKKMYILRGNHDYIDESIPFFKFLNHIKTIQFITEPTIVPLNSKDSLLVPNTRDFSTVEIPDGLGYIFCHQTFKGAKGEQGFEMDGIDPKIFDDFTGLVISGDIHTPQKMYHDKIVYVGSPYHVHFGDQYLPRVLLLNDDESLTSLHFKTTRRYTVNISSPSDLNKIPISKGDQVKIRLSLEDMVNWEEYRQQLVEYCSSHELDLHQIEFVKQNTALSIEAQKIKLKSLTPQELYERYCKLAKVGEETLEIGKQIIERENQ